MDFKNWLLSETTFQTSQGSVYTLSGNQTTRLKSLHAFHDKGDVGLKRKSDLTVYIDPELAREIGMWGTSSFEKRRIVLANGKVHLLSLNPKSNEHGLDRLIHNPDYTTEPKIGLAPLELWDRDTFPWKWNKPGLLVFKASHPGNPIVKFE